MWKIILFMWNLNLINRQCKLNATISEICCCVFISFFFFSFISTTSMLSCDTGTELDKKSTFFSSFCSYLLIMFFCSVAPTWTNGTWFLTVEVIFIPITLFLDGQSKCWWILYVILISLLFRFIKKKLPTLFRWRQ